MQSNIMISGLSVCIYGILFKRSDRIFAELFYLAVDLDSLRNFPRFPGCCLFSPVVRVLMSVELLFL